MALQEIMEKAKGGDVSAMLCLGEYCLDQKTGEGISAAAEWYKKAAEKNNTIAAYNTTGCKKVIAYAEADLDGYEAAIDAFRDFYVWSKITEALYLSGADGSDKVSENEIQRNIEDASYSLAFGFSRAEKYPEACMLLAENETERSAILFALSKLYMAEKKEEYDWALERLDMIRENREYSEREKTVCEEHVFACAAIHLSEADRVGIGPWGRKPNTKVAVRTLNYALEKVKGQHAKDLINEELEHYQKGLFGRYYYVEE